MKVVAQEQKNYRKPSYRKQNLRSCQEQMRSSQTEAVKPHKCRV
jgi:hypothetical protein